MQSEPQIGIPRSVNISPGVSMLAVLSHLNYKAWFALAEYVDNSLQSMLANRESLIRTEGSQYGLEVSIDIDSVDGGSISIRDNAAGIRVQDFPRAFRAAEIPPDRSGLSEFGMGMKSASCWFANEWTVRTTALGSPQAFEVKFDIADIVSDQLEELAVTPSDVAVDAHFTEVVLRSLNHIPQRRTIHKIKQHLRDIYRVFLRNGDLRLRINGEPIVYEEQAVLQAPYYKDLEGQRIGWRKDIEFDLGQGQRVSGFAALRETGSTLNSGFSLFRRGRVIQGSGDDGYRPERIFGAGNSFRSQRLFGELHLEGFAVSHTKDGFQWDSSEEPFLELLREELDAEPMALLRQAEGYRARVPTVEQGRAVSLALGNTALAAQSNLPIAIPVVAALPREDAPQVISQLESIRQRVIEFQLNDQQWRILVDVIPDPAESKWMSRSIDDRSPSSHSINIRLNSAHPFVLRFGLKEPDAIEAVLRFAIAIVVGEVLARDAGVRQVGTMTRNIDQVLTRALSEA